MSKGISVIVCCYNSAQLLPKTLRHLSEQVTSIDLEWEVIVVDNNSNDNTAEVARVECNRFGKHIPLKVVSEAKAGLSYARHRGISESQFDIIIFCDDDNWLNPHYIQKAFGIMSSDSKIGILGGLNVAVSDIELPFWFKEFEQAYACGPQAEQDGEVPNNRLYVTGAGMVIRKNIFLHLTKIGHMSQLSDRKGKELSSGGDAEIGIMSSLLGYKTVYSSQLQLLHYMQPDRLKWSYLVKLMKGHAKSSYKLVYYYDIYNNIDNEKSWIVGLWRRSKPLLGKRGILLVRNYFYVVKVEGNFQNIMKMQEIERWLAHFKMFSKYSDFMNYLNHIQKKIIFEKGRK